MNNSSSELEVSMSPGQILERLQILRQIQILQKENLSRQRLDFNNSSQNDNDFQTLLRQITANPNISALQKLLQQGSYSGQDTSLDSSRNISQRITSVDLVDGVEVLNLSQESECMVVTDGSTYPNTSRSSRSGHGKTMIQDLSVQVIVDASPVKVNKNQEGLREFRKQIELDEMPIISPRKDFEELLIEKLDTLNDLPRTSKCEAKSKKPFLKKGVGLARFGVSKDDLVIQDTRKLPWRRRSLNKKSQDKSMNTNVKTCTDKSIKGSNKVTNVRKSSIDSVTRTSSPINVEQNLNLQNPVKSKLKVIQNEICIPQLNFHKSPSPTSKLSSLLKPKSCKPDTWASILTRDQENFLNGFDSPSKSALSELSFDEVLARLAQDREKAEQNMFEIIENKACQENFNIEGSFINRFLKRNSLQDSKNDTPHIMDQCLKKNPQLLKLYPEPQDNATKRTESSSQYCSECCDHETCSTISTCSTCQTANNTPLHSSTPQIKDEIVCEKENDNSKIPNAKNIILEDTEKDKNDEKAKLANMNSELISTSNLLKQRLHELEDEIEEFRKENSNLHKIREDLDQERQKFYEEKAAYEQKLTEEKVLADYYLAEEKEKIAKQKQIYDRQIRELRGRLNKKDKDQVMLLNKEIEQLKEEIRVKDAKSTTVIAKLRNQVKILDKEKKELQEECEKLKLQNRRLQQTNTTTRRLSNIKYLQEINKKLSLLGEIREVKSDVYVDRDSNYKSEEIGKKSKQNKVVSKSRPLTRAKSAPNLNVTSRYAKYFSQRDAQSQKDIDELLFPSGDDMQGIDCNSNYEFDAAELESEVFHPHEIPEDDEIEQMYIKTFSSIETQNPKRKQPADFDLIENQNLDRKSSLSSLTSKCNYSNKQSSNKGRSMHQKNTRSSLINDFSDSDEPKLYLAEETFPRSNSRHDCFYETSNPTLPNNEQLKHALYKNPQNNALKSHFRRSFDNVHDENHAITHLKPQRKSYDNCLAHRTGPRDYHPEKGIQKCTSYGYDEVCRPTSSQNKSPVETYRPNSRRSFESELSRANSRQTDNMSRKSSEISETSRHSSSTSISNTKSMSIHMDISKSNDGLNYEENTRRSCNPNEQFNVNPSHYTPTEMKRADGSKELRFPNGNVKLISADGHYSKFIYYNGDIKETFHDEGRIKYFYAESKTCHTTHPDGLEVLEFPDGQVEKTYRDGSREIRLPNGSIRYTDPKNQHVAEEWRFPDGTILTVSKDEEKVIRFPNGQVDVHTKDHKRREYPDGTVKIVYKDGSTETRFASGRIRVKDTAGNLVMDTGAKR